MASPKTFTDGELNYFRICYIVTRVVPEELRKFFKQEWDKFFKVTYGEWRDTAKNAIDFYNMESPRNRTRNARLLAVMANGNTSEWDCTCLFYALLYSDSLGKSLKHSPAWTSVDALREIRNEVFAHTIDGSLEDVDFQASVRKVLAAFSALKFDPLAVEDMKNQKSFLTDELSNVQQELETEKKRNAELFSFCVLPPKPSHDTTERLEEVSSIYEEMTKLRNAKKKETTVTYLSGNPGCGKSEMTRQIGQKYFKEEADEGADLRFVFTLNGFSLDTLLQSYVEFAGRLNCDQDCITSINTSKDISKEEKIVQIRGFIATRIQTYSSWLLIVDNVVDLRSVFQYLPQAGEKTFGKGQILVTTQDSQSIPKSDSYTYHTSLSPGMTEEDSIALLCHVSGLESKDDDTLEVAKALDFQPLALACAAVYMKQICSTGMTITWGKYLLKLQNDQLEATEAAYEETSLAYRATMTTAVKLALEREVDKNEVMMHAFRFLSSVAPNPIPLKYAVQYVKSRTPEQDEDLLAAKISSSSLVMSSGNDSVEVRLHQVVYHCLQNFLNEGNASECSDLFDVVLAFSDICSFNMNKMVDVAETRKLVPHFRSIAAKLQPFKEKGDLQVFTRNSFFTSITTKLKSFFKFERRPSFVRDSALYSKFALVPECLSKIGNICSVHGCYQASSTCLQIVYMIQKETVNRENDPSLAHTLKDIGNSYLELGQYENARVCLERALNIQNNAYGNNHPSVANTLNVLSTTVRRLGDFGKAKMYLERALIIEENVYGSNHPALSATLNNLGCTFRELGQYEKSKIYLEKSLAMEELFSEENHSTVAVRLNNLAITLQYLGQHEKAKEYLERALSIDQNVYGGDHPLIATRLYNLGQCLKELQKYKEAKACVERSLEIREKMLGPTHSLFVLSLATLGSILIMMGHYDEGKTHLDRALHINAMHPYLVGSLCMLGNVLRTMGRHDEARTYLDRSLVIAECYNSSDLSSSFASSLSTLGAILIDMGQYKEARTCLERALANVERTCPNNRQLLAITLNNLGKSLYDLGHLKEAKTFLERAVFIDRQLHHKHPAIGVPLSNLSSVLLDLGQYQQSEETLNEAISLQENAYGVEHPYVTKNLRYLGRMYHRLGKHDKAKAHFERGLAILDKNFGPSHPKSALLLNDLGDLLVAMGQYEDAKANIEKALEIQRNAFGEDSILVAITLKNLAKTIHVMGQQKEAGLILEKVLKIQENTYGANNPYVAEVLSIKGEFLFESGQYGQSRECFERALAIQVQVYDEGHPLLAETSGNLQRASDKESELAEKI